MLTGSSASTLYVAGDNCGDRVIRARQKYAEAASDLTISTRRANAQDIRDYYGDAPRETIRAYVADINGSIVGIVGIFRSKDSGIFFSEFKPELQPYLKSITIMRTIKKALSLCDEYRGPVFALADNAESCRLMNRLGFTHLHGAWYGWLT
jgi:hypothetical protein